MAIGLSKLLIAAPVVFSCGMIGSASAYAQVETDGTVGPRLKLDGPEFAIRADLGTRAGRNLFHSFERFSLDAGERATFSGPDAIRNVISRVTGGERSDIDGTIASTIPGADFYFLNPAGVVFRPNASLDVQGSFHVSTADELRFADGAKFSATDRTASSFTVAAPEAFGFLGSSPAPILIDESILEVPTGKSFSIVGGAIDIVGGPLGFLRAEAGRITLAALGSPGAAAVADGGITATAFADIHLTDQALVRGDTVRIRGGRLVVENSSSILAPSTGATGARGGMIIDAGAVTVTSGSGIATRASGTGDAARLTVQADALEVRNGGQISSTTSGEGDAGTVTIDATGPVEVRNGGEIGSATSAEGNAGTVTIDATGLVEVRNRGQISSTTSAEGNAGTVTVTAGRVFVDGEGSDATTIASRANMNSSGNAGTVTIVATGLVEVRNGGQISGSTSAEGDGGTVKVTAGRVLVDAEGNTLSTTGISSQANRTSSGNAGTVTIVATGLVEVRNRGQISSTTFAQGNAGKVTVAAGRLLVHGEGLTTSIASQADRGSRGNAGTVAVDTEGLLELRNGGGISSSTFAAGDAGGVTVEAGRLLIDSDGSADATGIGSQAEVGSSGDAGRVMVKADGIEVRDGGSISSSALANAVGSAGGVTVEAGRLLVDGDGSMFRTGIASDTGSSSRGGPGTVTVNVTGLVELRDGGEITGSTFAKSDAGDVTVKANRLLIDDEGNASFFTGIASQANTGSSGNAGKVTVIAETMEVHNGGEVASSSFAGGRAGNVIVRVPQLVVRDDSVIASSGRGTGPAGNVRIEVDSLLVANAGIRTVGTGATGGEILVEADDLIHLVEAEVTSNGIEPGARASLITLIAPQIALNDSRVTSLFGAGEPRGGSGEARLLGDTTVISTDSEVAASSTVEITGQEADLGSQLVTLEGAFIDTAPLRTRCGARRDIGASSFTGVGRGGLPPSPDGPLASAYIVDEALVAEAQTAELRPTTVTAPADVRLAGLSAPCAPLD